MDNSPENVSRPGPDQPLTDMRAADAPAAADFPELLKRFEAQTEYRNKAVFSFIVVIFALLWLAGQFEKTHRPTPNFSYSIPGVVLSSVVLLTGIVCWFSYSRSRPTNEVLRLIEQNDIKALGPLIARSGLINPRNENILVKQAIAGLLLRLSPDEAEALSSVSRATLNERLTTLKTGLNITAENADLGVAWLKVLEQIGGGPELVTVKSLSRTRSNNTAKRRVVQAAQECLPFIEARAAAESPGKTLLRASAPEGAAPETLLRPASSANMAPPDQLLRAAGQENAQDA